MKKNLVRRPNITTQIRDLNTTDRQVQKFLALEDHPRRKDESVNAFNYPASIVALMF